jgi:hypothetical protein
LYGPLPATPGRVLCEILHAGDVWTTAPWSAAVLSAHSYELDGRCWLDELRWLADYNSDPPLCSGWGDLSAGQVACKLLVVWKMCWWPHWSALPYPEFRVLDLADDQSFDQYSLPSLEGSHWDEPVWQPAWTKAYSAYFLFYVCAVAGDAASVPCLYSLALRSLFFWFQRAGEHTVYDPEWHPPLVSDFPVEYTRVRVSRVARDWLHWESD